MHFSQYALLKGQWGWLEWPLTDPFFEGIAADLRVLEIDEIKRRLEPVIIGYSVQSPVFDAGVSLYRARKVGSAFNKMMGITYKDLIYPPKHLATLGRLNRVGEPVFYSSLHKESVFFELPDLKVGDELILTFWKTTEQMFVNNVGYTDFAFQQLGAKRAVPTWEPSEAPAHAKGPGAQHQQSVCRRCRPTL
jgi:hypothetical protein